MASSLFSYSDVPGPLRGDIRIFRVAGMYDQAKTVETPLSDLHRTEPSRDLSLMKAESPIGLAAKRPQGSGQRTARP